MDHGSFVRVCKDQCGVSILTVFYVSSRAGQNYIHVVLGIIRNTRGEVLVTKRGPDTHLGGYFEFPGGKLEENESPEAGLVRELKEELSIELHQCRPLIQIPYSYPDRKVFLDVFMVVEYSGTAHVNKVQEACWKKISDLDDVEFPDANHGIIRALQLPGLISVTPSLDQDRGFLQHFEKTVKKEEISIIHLRSHELDIPQYLQLAERCLKRCRRHLVYLVLNGEAGLLEKVDAAGLHLTSSRLLAVKERPLGKNYLVSASCHNLDEVLHASGIGLDYIFLGPVVEKAFGANTRSLGWKGFSQLARQSTIPVYAIGGLVAGDIGLSTVHGGQGIAAIRDVWHRLRSD